MHQFLFSCDTGVSLDREVLFVECRGYVLDSVWGAVVGDDSFEAGVTRRPVSEFGFGQGLVVVGQHVQLRGPCLFQAPQLIQECV